MKSIHSVAFVLLVIGGINWLLIGLGDWFGGNWNVVYMLLGSWMWLESLVYVLVGLSAVYLAIKHKTDCKHCEKPGGGM